MAYLIRELKTEKIKQKLETLEEAVEEIENYKNCEIVLKGFWVEERHKNGEIIDDGLTFFDTLEDAEKYGKDEYRHLSEREKRDREVIVCDGEEIFDDNGSGSCLNLGFKHYKVLGEEKDD